MSLFVCEECGCIENTALSRYWLGSRLCSVCDPEIGKWHGMFEREQYNPAKDQGRVRNPPGAVGVRVSPCRSCRRSVWWATSAKGKKPMPLDRDDARGNVVVDVHGRAHVFKDHEAALAAAEHDDALGPINKNGTFISHHARCPHGTKWKGKKRSDPDSPQGMLPL